MNSYLIILTIDKILLSIIGIGLFVSNTIQYFDGKREKLRNAFAVLFGCFFVIFLLSIIEQLLLSSDQKVYSMQIKPRYFKLNFTTSHHQFYISDNAVDLNTGTRNFWTKEASQDRLAIENGILGVGTECYGPVKAELYILNKKTDEANFDQYDHIVEGVWKLNQGK